MLALIGSAVLMAACSAAVAALNFITPSTGYTVNRDIAYGPDERQKLDIYIPAQRDARNTVLLFFYGGSWQWGSKDDYLFVGQAFAAQGYTTIIADYRIYPQHFYPAFLEDAASAAQWAHKNAATYKADPDRIFLAGHSAGGYLALGLAADTRYLNGTPTWLKGTIGIASPYDFLPLTDKNLIALFGTANPIEQSQPITHIHANMPPALLVTGTDDVTVLPKNSSNLAARMRALGNDVTLRVYPGISHYDIALSLAHHFQNKSPLMNDIKAFISSR